jgi:hypothetical protein
MYCINYTITYQKVEYLKLLLAKKPKLNNINLIQKFRNNKYAC